MAFSDYGDRKNRGKLFMNKLWKRVLKGLLFRVLTRSFNELLFRETIDVKP